MQTNRSIAKIFLIFLVVFITALPVIVRSDDSFDTKNLVIKSASELNYPPFSIIRSDGTADGFSVELLKAVIHEIGRDISFEVAPWIEIKRKLIAGDLDVLPLVSFSEDRDKVLDFTAPYLRMHGTIFVRKGEKTIRGEADLKGKEVLVMEGDTAHEYAINKKLSDKLILTDSFEKAMELLSNGKHDAVIIQQLVGFQLIKKLKISNVVDVGAFRESSLKPTAKPLSGFVQKFCFAVPEGNKELLSYLNEGLNLVIANGTYKKIYDKWFSPILPLPSVSFATIAKYLFFILIPVLFILGVIGIWYLKKEIGRKTGDLKTEIIDREQAQTALQLSLDAANAGTWSWNILTGEVIWDDQMQIIFGFEPGKFDGTFEGWKNRVHPDDIQAAEKATMNALGHDDGYDCEYRVMGASGGWDTVNAMAVTSRDDDGKAIWMSGFAMDITQQKETERKLKESEEKFKVMFERAPLSYQSLDGNGNFTEVNQTWLQTMGYTRDEVLGRNFSEFLVPEWKNHFAQNFPRFKAVGEVIGVEFEMVKKDGAVILVSFHGKIGKNSDGTFKQTHCIFNDVTNQRRMEEEKEVMEQKMTQIQRIESIGSLAGGIAHDFNNILFPIMGLSEMLMEDLPKDSQEYENAQQILAAGKRGSDLVSQILSFSRQHEHKLIPIRIEKILKEAIKLSRSTIPTNIEISKNIQQGCGLVMADPTQLHQVAMNLITNAFHAIENSSGKIDIAFNKIDLCNEELPDSLLQLGQYVKFSVSDNGVGMSKETINKIFEPYFTTKEKSKGTGLGLAVVYGIVKEHKGEIKVNSEVGKGTTFSIYLPLVDKAAEVVSSTQIRELETGTEKILLVDDEKPIIMLVTRMLERLGYHVTCYLNSKDAFAEFKTDPEKYDLVITDMTMPNMTGDKLAKEILSIRSDIPVIICTGFSERINKEQAETIGVNGFLMKPVVKSEMAKMVRKMLDESGAN